MKNIRIVLMIMGVLMMVPVVNGMHTDITKMDDDELAQALAATMDRAGKVLSGKTMEQIKIKKEMSARKMAKGKTTQLQEGSQGLAANTARLRAKQEAAAQARGSAAAAAPTNKTGNLASQAGSFAENTARLKAKRDAEAAAPARGSAPSPAQASGKSKTDSLKSKAGSFAQSSSALAEKTKKSSGVGFNIFGK